MFEPAYIKILDWNTAKDKMWNGIGWYGFIGVITSSTTDISLISACDIKSAHFLQSGIPEQFSNFLSLYNVPCYLHVLTGIKDICD